jgi:hypothetical protein
MRKFLSAYSYFFLRIRRICIKYLGAYEACRESIYAYSENAQKVFKIWRIQQMQGCLRYSKSSLNTRKVLTVFGEYAERIYMYMEYTQKKNLSTYSLTTPRDIKVCISQLITIQFLKFFRFFLSTLYGMT